MANMKTAGIAQRFINGGIIVCMIFLSISAKSACGNWNHFPEDDSHEVQINCASDFIPETFTVVTVVNYIQWGNLHSENSVDESMNVSLVDYITGVVLAELNDWPEAVNSKKDEGVKAQAVAALEKLAFFVNSPNGSYTVSGKSDNQVCGKLSTYYDSLILNHVKGLVNSIVSDKIVLEYSGNLTQGLFCGSPGIFSDGSGLSFDDMTTGSYNYTPDLRITWNLPNENFTADSAASRPLGMNQDAMCQLALNGVSFDKILHHFYHPAPPILQRVRISSLNGLDSDNYDYDSSKVLTSLFINRGRGYEWDF